MRSRRRASLVATAIGGLFTIIGTIGFLIIIVGVYLGEPEGSFGNIHTIHIVGIIISMVFVSVGRTIGWKYGYGIPGGSIIGGGAMMQPSDQGPNRSPLEQLGYHIPPESDEDDGYTLGDDGKLRVTCSTCGSSNDPTYTFCGECSARLPDAD